MRYQEAYEIVQRLLHTKYKVSIPISQNLMDTYFDPIIESIGLRVVKKKDTQVFTTVGSQTEYVLTNTNISKMVYKVQPGNGSPVPPIPEKTAPIDEGDNILNVGYYLKTDKNTGIITAATQADPIKLTSVDHGLITGDAVDMSEISGLLSATGTLSEVNGIRHSITKVDDDNFSIPIDGSSYAVAYASGGKFQEDTHKIIFTKSLDAGITLTIYYIAKPEIRSSIVSNIDLHATLVLAAIHHVIGGILHLDAQVQMASAQRGVANKYELDYIDAHGVQEPIPYLIPFPMPDFT